MELEKIQRTLGNVMLDVADIVAEPGGIDVFAVIELKTAIDLMSAAAQRLEAADMHQTRAIASNPVALAAQQYGLTR